MWTAKFWKDLAERAASTAVEALLAASLAGTVASVGWKQTLLIVGGATLLAVGKGFLASYRGDPSSASLANVSLGSGLQRFDGEGTG